MATACDGVRLRTGPTTGDAQVGSSLFAGTPVSVETTITGGSWSATCAAGPVSGNTWHQISEVNGQSVAALYGVPFVYSAIGSLPGGSRRRRRPRRQRRRPIRSPRQRRRQIPSRHRRRPRHRPRLPTPFVPVTEGIDVSHWQNTIDWNQVAACRQAVRLHEGVRGHDADRRRSTTGNRAQAKALGLYVGAYHFARPDRNPGDAIAEADYFLAMSQLAAGDLLPVLDLEVTAGWRRSSSRNGSSPTSGGSTSGPAPAA